MNISALYARMVLIFLAIAIGVLSGKTGILDKHASERISAFVIWIACPMLTLGSVLGTEHLLSNGEVGLLSAFITGCLVFLMITGTVIPKLLRIPKDDEKACGVYKFMYNYSNMGFMGYPIVSALFGEGALFFVTLFMTILNFFIFSYGAALMRGKIGSISDLLRRTFTHPAVISGILGLVLYLLNVRVPALVTDCLFYIGDLTTPLALVALGITLSRVPLKTVFGNGRIYALSFIKLIIIPVIVYFIMLPLSDSELIRGFIVVEMSTPVAAIAPSVAMENGGDAETASAGAFLSTIISLITIPTMMWLLFTVIAL